METEIHNCENPTCRKPFLRSLSLPRRKCCSMECAKYNKSRGMTSMVKAIRDKKATSMSDQITKMIP